MLSVETVWVMFSVTGCNTLSTRIREPIRQKNISLYFAAIFNGPEPEQKTIDSTKNLLNVHHDYSQIVNATVSIEQIMFKEKELNTLELTKNFDHFGQQKTKCRSKQCPYALRQFFLQIKLSIALHLGSLRDNHFQKQLQFSRREQNGESWLLVSTLTGLLYYFSFNEVVWWLVWFCKQFDHLCLQTYAVCHSSWTKKLFFTTKENLWPIFSPIFECEKF